MRLERSDEAPVQRQVAGSRKKKEYEKLLDKEAMVVIPEEEVTNKITPYMCT